VAATPDAEHVGYESVGSREDLDHFFVEYGLTADDVPGKVAVRTTMGVRGAPGPDQYLVHESLLRSHGEFPCAGDAAALAFCRRVAAEMVTALGVSEDEAVARINRAWSTPDAGGRTPRIWIIGRDIVYHETPSYWARTIYYGPDSFWWLPGATPAPLPPPR
jgi:hypothetical protein